MERAPSFAVIGGSGLYEIPGLRSAEKVYDKTPFGMPSAPIAVGEIEGTQVAFLARHGEGHHISPSEINYRANIYALKRLGIDRVIGVSACGSLREEIAPEDIVIPDQLFDFTKGRDRTFFGGGIVVHVSVSEPFCPDLSRKLYDSVVKTGTRVHQGGNFITIEGPRFSTKAESETFRYWKMDLVGMTTSPEAFLAREAEMCYSVMALVTDYDVWRGDAESVSVDKIVEVMNKNTKAAIKAIVELSQQLGDEKNCECSQALENAIMTRPEAIGKEARQRLSILLNKYLK